MATFATTPSVLIHWSILSQCDGRDMLLCCTLQTLDLSVQCVGGRVKEFASTLQCHNQKAQFGTSFCLVLHTVIPQDIHKPHQVFLIYWSTRYHEMDFFLCLCISKGHFRSMHFVRS